MPNRLIMKKDFIEVYNRLQVLHTEFTELRLKAYELGYDYRETRARIVDIIHESVTIICSRKEYEDIFFAGKSERYRSEYRLSRIFLATNYTEYMPKFLTNLKKAIVEMHLTSQEHRTLRKE